jgi:hypothetical protein
MFTLQRVIVVLPFLVVAMLLVWRTKHGWRYALGAIVGPLVLSMSASAARRTSLWWMEYRQLIPAKSTAVVIPAGARTRIVRFQRDSAVTTPALRYREPDRFPRDAADTSSSGGRLAIPPAEP